MSSWRKMLSMPSSLVTRKCTPRWRQEGHEGARGNAAPNLTIAAWSAVRQLTARFPAATRRSAHEKSRSVLSAPALRIHLAA
jgi:hypothetical protein